jgi:thioredoxin 1
VSVIELTQDNFQAEVLNRAEPVLVDFTATWCGPCRLMAPIVDQLAEEFQGRVVVGKLDIDQNGALAGQYGVMAVPTLIVFKAGEPAFRQVGLTSKDALVAKVREVLGTQN